MFTIPQEMIIYIVAGMALILAFLFIWIIKIDSRIKNLTRGQNNLNIETAIKSIENDLKNFGLFKNDIEKYLNQVEKRLKKSIQGVKTINFKAFQGLDSGGHQSFATAFLNEHGDGIIISTLHSRDRVNVFAKEIKNFNSILTLTSEEKEALTQAQESCKL